MAPAWLSGRSNPVGGSPLTDSAQQQQKMQQKMEVSRSEATSFISKGRCATYFCSSRVLRAAAVGAALFASVYSCGEIPTKSISCRRGRGMGWWHLQPASAAEAEEDTKEAEDESEAATSLSGAKLAELLQMDLKEIQERMEALFGLIDSNSDDQIDKDEAKEWSLKLKGAMHQHQVEMEFQAIDKNNDGNVSFEELSSTYVSGSDQKQLEEHKEEVRKRFKAVDKDHNDMLSMEEVMLLMDPGKDEDLTRLEIEEILATQDKNKDQKITLQEFIETEGGNVTESEKQELQKEFSAYDLDKDGSIDADELRKIIKDPHAHEIETMLEEFLKELKDGVLPKSRWLKEYEKFAVSMLTDNGEALRYPDDYKGIKFPYTTSTGTAPTEKESKEHDEL